MDRDVRITAPCITVDGRIHGLTSDFLRNHCLSRPDAATDRRIAPDLSPWLRFLCNECDLVAFEDWRDPVLVATEDGTAARSDDKLG